MYVCTLLCVYVSHYFEVYFRCIYIAIYFPTAATVLHPLTIHNCSWQIYWELKVKWCVLRIVMFRYDWKFYDWHTMDKNRCIIMHTYSYVFYFLTPSCSTIEYLVNSHRVKGRSLLTHYIYRFKNKHNIIS